METRRGVMTQGGRRAVITSALLWRPRCQVIGMPEKLKPRGAAAKPRRDKSRTPSRAPSRHSKRPSRKPSPQPTPATPAEDGRGSAPGDGDVRETLDVGDILDELLDRVINESALAALLRQRVPFAVSRVRDAILCIAEWRFPPRDEGDLDPGGDPDPERDGVWSEDEEPQTCPCDCWAAGAVPVLDVPVPSGEVPCQDLLVTAEAVCPGRVPGVPLPSEQVPDAKPPCQEPPEAAGVHPAEVPGAVTVLPVPGPPRPEPSTAPRPPGRDTRLARPPRPRPALLCPPRPPEPPGGGSGGLQVPPSPKPSSRSSLESIEPLTPSRGRRIIPGVPRLGVRRGATGWVTPEVKVLDVAAELELLRAQGRRSRGWLLLRGSLHVLAGPPRPPKTQPQLCDPWLAAARLAPGVTVRCGGTERRGPGTVGHEQEEKEKEEKRVRKLERELKPIRRYPVCRMSEEGEW